MLKKIAALAMLSVGAAAAEPVTLAPEPGPSASSAAQPDYTLAADYNVTLLGLGVGSMHVELAMKDGQYQVSAHVQPEGLASTFTSNAVNANGSGMGTVGHLMPTHSWVQQVSSKRTQVVEISFTNGDPTKVDANPVYDTTYAPTEEQKKQTVDPMNAIMALMLLPTASGTGADACGSTVPIYDGKRRYNFLMSSQGIEQVQKGTGGYAGPALHCVIHYQRIAGWDPDHVAQGSKTEIHLYLAPIGKTPGSDAPAFWFPVRLWSDAEVGNVVAIPSSVTINGKAWAQFFADGG